MRGVTYAEGSWVATGLVALGVISSVAGAALWSCAFATIPGLSSGHAAGLSATNIARLTNEWEAEYRAFQKRSLADRPTSTCGLMASTSTSGWRMTASARSQ